MAAEQVWQQALGELKLQMTKGTFDTWLQGATLDRYEDGVFFIAVPTEYARDWLQNRLLLTVTRTLTGLMGKPTQVRFVVNGEPPAEPVMEVISERRVSYTADGQTRQEENWYLKIRRNFSHRALRLLKGAPLSVFICLACEADEEGEISGMDEDEIASKTGYATNTVRKALEVLENNGFIISRKQYRAPQRYNIRGYAWIGRNPKPPLLGEEEVKPQNLRFDEQVKAQNLRFESGQALAAEGITEPNLSRCIEAAAPEEIEERIKQYRWLLEQGKITKNGPGYLASSILESYDRPKGYPQ